MARKPWSVLLAVAMVSLTVVVLSVGNAASQVVTSLSLNFAESEPDAVTDGGKSGPSVGDVFFFKGGLTDDDAVKVGSIIAQASSFLRAERSGRWQGRSP